MEILMTARVTGPFGEINRRQRLSSDKYPSDYLVHLVDIGVAEYTVEHKVEQPIEVKTPQKVDLTKKSSSALQPGQALRKRTARRSKKAAQNQ